MSVGRAWDDDEAAAAAAAALVGATRGLAPNENEGKLSSETWTAKSFFAACFLEWSKSSLIVKWFRTLGADAPDDEDPGAPGVAAKALRCRQNGHANGKAGAGVATPAALGPATAAAAAAAAAEICAAHAKHRAWQHALDRQGRRSGAAGGGAPHSYSWKQMPWEGRREGAVGAKELGRQLRVSWLASTTARGGSNQ
jgi:hypothetical protein